MDKEKTMKFYSEKLNEVFDTVEELQSAEKSKSKKKKAPVVESKEETTPSRKDLAANIEAAEKKLADAYAEYEVSKKQVEELSKTYLESVSKILTPAKEAVKKAEQDKYEAIRTFNESFGAYQQVLTGDKAAKEMVRAINEINSLSRKIWNDFFWF